MKVEFTPAGNRVKHGGSGMGYRSYGCRCLECTEANRARHMEEQKRRVEGVIPDTVAHGKASTYNNWGCRCDPCKNAHIAKCDSYYSRKLSAQARYDAELAAYESGVRKGPKPVLRARDNRDSEALVREFVDINKHLPRRRSENDIERKLFYRLSSARDARKTWALELFSAYRAR